MMRKASRNSIKASLESETFVRLFHLGDHVDDIYDGIDLMKKQIIEKRAENQIGIVLNSYCDFHKLVFSNQ